MMEEEEDEEFEEGEGLEVDEAAVLQVGVGTQGGCLGFRNKSSGCVWMPCAYSSSPQRPAGTALHCTVLYL